jgi:hypothetical protein
MPDRPEIANVVEWRNEQGWGVLEADEIPERLAQVEGPLDFLQDGYRYRATSVRPLS